MKLMNRLINDQQGQGLVEYSLIVALIALTALGAMTASGTSIQGVLNRISSQLDTVLP